MSIVQLISASEKIIDRDVELIQKKAKESK
jgi:hypothetical protein